MKKVLYFSSQFPNTRNPNIGVFSFQRVLALQKVGFEIQVICPLQLNPPPGLIIKPGKFIRWVNKQLRVPGDLSFNGIPVFFLKWISPPKKIFGWHVSQFLFFQVRKVVMQQINSFQPDVIISSWLPDAIVISRIANRFRIPIISIADGTDVNTWPEEYPGWNNVKKVLNEKIDVLVFVSKALQKVGNSKGLFAKKNIVVHNSVDIDLFKPDNSYHVNGCISILGVGRLVPMKGFDILLRAVDKINKYSDKPIKLILVGDGPQREKLLKLASHLGISKLLIVKEPMPQEKLVRVYQQADIFCLPSFSEGLPCVVLEAMACGKPIVASNVGGVSEVVTKDTGILVKPGDEEDLHKALSQAIDMKWDQNLIRKEVVEKFSAKIWADQMVDIIQLVTSK